MHRVLRRDVIPRIFFIQGVRIRSLAALTIEAAKAVIENKQKEKKHENPSVKSFSDADSASHAGRDVGPCADQRQGRREHPI